MKQRRKIIVKKKTWKQRRRKDKVDIVQRNPNGAEIEDRERGLN